MTNSLIIFNCDGVLVDSAPIVIRLLVGMLADLNIKVDYGDAMHNFAGRSTSAISEIIKSRFGRNLKDSFFQTLLNRALLAFENELSPIAGVQEALYKIPLPMCVSSNSDHQHTRAMLESAGLLSMFEPNIFCVNEVARAKPAPDLFLYVADRMRAAPRACLVVEDSISGIRAGLAANMTVLAFAKNGETRTLAEAGAKLIFNAMDQLPNLVKLTTNSHI